MEKVENFMRRIKCKAFYICKKKKKKEKSGKQTTGFIWLQVVEKLIKFFWEYVIRHDTVNITLICKKLDFEQGSERHVEHTFIEKHAPVC